MSQPNKVLSKMLDRLFAGLMNGPGMNCRPHNSRQRVDLTQFSKLQDITPQDVLKQLLSADRQATAVARVKPPKNRGEDQEDGEPSPKEKTWDDQTALLNKLRVIVEDSRTYENDTGVHVLNVGYPLLSLPPGSFSTGSRNSTKRILAPVAFVPITLSLKRGSSPSVELACRGEGVDLVIPNSALLAWLEQQTGNIHADNLYADEEGENPWREICDLVSHVATALKLEIPEEFKSSTSTATNAPSPADAGSEVLRRLGSDAEESGSSEYLRPGVTKSSPQLNVPPNAFQLRPAPRGDDESDSPTILSSAVLGLFPTANQGLLRDTQHMLAESADPAAARLTGPVESFLTTGIDFDDCPAPLFDAHPADSIKASRRFDTERLAADADPCQSRAVSLARDSRGLVVHGPPGTGKSQTITNIIADHLSRGQSVLLVCEKRTALDVVADRLEHMGLRPLCAIVHDPQRDQRDLYKSIRQQLDDLPELKTNPQAQSQLARFDADLQKLHDDLSRYHHSLMTPPRAHAMSFHELMGRWLAIEPGADARITDAAAHAISPADLDAREPDLLDLLRRAQTVDYGRNPWAKCTGISLTDFLNRPMESVRTALDRCAAAAATADAAIEPNIPPFSTKSPLPLQGQARAEIAARLDSLAKAISPSAITRWVNQDATAIRSAQQKLRSLDATITTFRAAPLDADLRTAVDPLPNPTQIAQQLWAIDSYLQVAGKWYAVFSFGTKSEATKVLRIYGLPTTATEAARLKKYLLGLRARLAIAQLRAEITDITSPLAPDDVLDRFLTQHAEWFDLLLRLAEDPVLDGLISLAKRALPDQSAAASFIDGLRKSPSRADAVAKLEEELVAAGVFDAAWLNGLGDKLRVNQPAEETITALIDRLDSLEGVLRVRESRATLDAATGVAADQLLWQSFDPQIALASLRKAVLNGEILRRLRADPNLQGIDAHRIESNFGRYRQLEDQKRQAVREAVQHQWVSRQKERLLAGTGTRLNSLGADLRRRLTIRGERAMRLRQVVANGERIDGGDPLFDLCPVWMASPETVAQVFPRKAVFDVVVFDEASQCRLEEALPVLTRGSRLVIAGDPKQLPPTRFFESAFTQSEEDEPETEQQLFESQQGEVEDLLAAALNLSIQQCYLDVHYRSRNADLIQFSNVNFYSSRLQAIPGHPSNRTDYSPVTLYRIDGTYSNRRNEAEAERVVAIVRELLEEKDPPSIGIACFNLQQRDLIVEKLDDAAADDSEFAKNLGVARLRKGQGSFEGLFVKNLENVQGDERDHIIISTTYGPDGRGKFYRRFGPLGRAGGGRRLNVLVTRARDRVHLVTSIPAEAYRNLPVIPEGQSAGGGWLLFAYLKYAEQLTAEYARLKERETEPGSRPTTPATNSTVEVHPSKSPSQFAIQLAESIATTRHVGSDVHWGNDGFCVDLAMRDPTRPGDVTVGVLCDSCRYAAAGDPVEWDIFRTGILTATGWKLRRVWTPHFFRDPSGHVAAIVKDAGEVRIPKPESTNE
jgi:AAA domain/REase_MTES_1575/Protein of unknown function (DUF4011)